MRAQPVPAIEGTAPAPSPSPSRHRVDLQYELSRADLSQLQALTGSSVVRHVVSTTGRLTGPADALHAVGDATINQLDAFGVRALTLVGHYDAVAPASDRLRRPRPG